jgi:2-polyprenyl-6-methoxyphenol hydroxylase-like FAD-dependent oxidoreductase
MPIETDVLIVGAGPVGLALAIELGSRGIRASIVERKMRGGSAPRAKTTNVRTRTHLRRWGLARTLADASPLGVDYPNDVLFTTGLSGYRLAHIRNAFNAAPARSPLYPEHAQWVPQYTLEKVLREHAQTLPGVQIQFDQTFLNAVQDQQGVVSTLRDTLGTEQTIRSRFLVGADGSRSKVRDVIGAKMQGAQGLSRNYNIMFRAHGMAQAHAQGRGVMYWQIGARGPSLIGPMDRDDVWFFMPTGIKEGERLSDAEAIEAITRTTGIALPYEILSADEWVASRLLADRYHSGRIFLAGDAAHLHPPFGGYGMNMGIGDGVDLGWKIAALIKGWGGNALLDSYDKERRPVHEAVIEEAVANHAILVTPLWREGLADDTPAGEAARSEVGAFIQANKTREFHTLGTVLGLGYEDSPLITYDGTPPPVRNNEVYTPSARPGQIAPHAWLSESESLYDQFGPDFTLIVAPSADEAQVAEAEAEARTFGVPLKILRPQGVAVRDMNDADLTLVRPDQHVAWRGDRWLARVLSRASGRSG